MSSTRKIGLSARTDVAVGNIMGSGIALLSTNLASIGSIAIWGWITPTIGTMLLAYVYAWLATKNPQQGGPIVYAGETSPAFDFQVGILYHHVSWIGSPTIGIIAVSYLSIPFPVLNDPVPAGITCIAIARVFIFVSMLGGTWVNRLTTIGLVLVLIPVVMTAIVDWHWFDAATYVASWGTTDTTDSHVITKSILLCPWAFVGVESAVVNTDIVKSPKHTIPLVTMLGTGLAGIVYITTAQALSGMYPSSIMAASGAPFAVSVSTIPGNWAASPVSAFTAFTCLISLGSWMMLVGQVGVRAANDGNFSKVCGEINSDGTPKKGLLLVTAKMTALIILITLMNSAGGRASDLFGELTGIAVLLTMLPYFYSRVDLIRFEDVGIRDFVSLICSVLGYVLCFTVLMDTSPLELAGTFIVGPITLMFYTRKTHERQSRSADNHIVSNAH